MGGCSGHARLLEMKEGSGHEIGLLAYAGFFRDVDDRDSPINVLRRNAFFIFALLVCLRPRRPRDGERVRSQEPAAPNSTNIKPGGGVDCKRDPLETQIPPFESSRRQRHLSR